MPSASAVYPYNGHMTPNPGELVVSGSFVVNGASAPDDTNAKHQGAGWIVGAPTTGVYTVTVRKGGVDQVPRRVISSWAGLSNGGANNAARAEIRDASTLPTDATFTIATQSAVGTDANLSSGEVVSFILVLGVSDVAK